MSFFKIECPECQKSLKVSENLAGKSRACPYCRATVRIPETPPPEPAVVFPGIQIADDPPAGKGRAKSIKNTAADGAERPPSLETSVSKKTIKRRLREKSWFSSSSESASSDVSLVLSGLIAASATLIWFAITFPMRHFYFGALFWARGPIPFPTTFLMLWALAILFLKWLNLKKQKNAMLLDVLPTEISREITVESLDRFIDNINNLPGASSDTFLVNRVIRGIEHFRVRRSAAETVTMMESQSAIDSNNVAGSYTILKVFIWSLPILGFIGTVMGVSQAVASLATSLSGGGQMDAMKAALQDVFAGLGTAFDTTLLALIMSMLVKIPASALQKSEEDVITSVDEYCNENLLRRLNDGREGSSASKKREDVAADADSAVFRMAVEQALGTHHAEMERWLEKLDKIGEHLTEQVSQGWDRVNDRIEQQQQRHVELLHEQQLDQQARLQAQLDQMANAADRIQRTLTTLGEQTATLQSQVNETFTQTSETLKQHLAQINSGLSSLSEVLQKLGDQQVVIQQVATDPARGSWFSRKAKKTRNRARS